MPLSVSKGAERGGGLLLEDDPLAVRREGGPAEERSSSRSRGRRGPRTCDCPTAKSIFAIVCPLSLSSWTKASCLPSGENAVVPPFLMTPSQPSAGMFAPVRGVVEARGRVEPRPVVGRRHREGAVGVEPAVRVVARSPTTWIVLTLRLQIVRRAREERLRGDQRRAVRARRVADVAASLLEDGGLLRARLDLHDPDRAEAAGELRAVRLVIDGAAEASLRDGPRLGDRAGDLAAGDLRHLHDERIGRPRGRVGDGRPRGTRERQADRPGGRLEVALVVEAGAGDVHVHRVGSRRRRTASSAAGGRAGTRSCRTGTATRTSSRRSRRPGAAPASSNRPRPGSR